MSDDRPSDEHASDERPPDARPADRPSGDRPSDEHAYEVGYRRPPRHTRFRKGQSGNPGGRPKGARNMATLVAKALDRRVVVSDNGRRRTVTKREAIIAQLVNKSAEADLKAMTLLLGLVQQVETKTGAAGAPGGDSTAGTAAATTAADRAVIENLIARLRADGGNR